MHIKANAASTQFYVDSVDKNFDPVLFLFFVHFILSYNAMLICLMQSFVTSNVAQVFPLLHDVGKMIRENNQTFCK